mmetsp:Transcript_2602/g.5644  ORF Transcript_2602/g.5644 Transcript_2602/m.5644 type:complete len:215 (-) Transcript_2602:314-958(-)
MVHSFLDFFLDFFDFFSFLVFFSLDSSIHDDDESSSFFFSFSSFLRFFSARFCSFSVGSAGSSSSLLLLLLSSLLSSVLFSEEDVVDDDSPLPSSFFFDSSFRERFFFLLVALLPRSRLLVPLPPAPMTARAPYGTTIPLVAVVTTSVFPKIQARSSALLAPNFAALIFRACPAKTLFFGRLSVAFDLVPAFFLAFSFLDFFRFLAVLLLLMLP